MDVHEAVKTKHAVRTFREDAVPESVILAILDAGRRSQSSKNTQPWHFIVVRDKETLQKLSEAGDYASHLSGAAFAIALIGESNGIWNMFDIGQASSYLQLAAWELGVGSCIATMHRADQAKAILNVPADHSFNLAISFGYPSADWKPAKMGGRKPIEELVRWEKWTSE